MTHGYHHIKTAGRASYDSAHGEKQFEVVHGKAVAKRCYECADRAFSHPFCKRAHCLIDDVTFERCTSEGEWQA